MHPLLVQKNASFTNTVLVPVPFCIPYILSSTVTYCLHATIFHIYSFHTKKTFFFLLTFISTLFHCIILGMHRFISNFPPVSFAFTLTYFYYTVYLCHLCFAYQLTHTVTQSQLFEYSKSITCI